MKDEEKQSTDVDITEQMNNAPRNLGNSGGGRKGKLTPELQTTFIEMIDDGCFTKTACQATGISVQTFHTWMNRGEKETEGIYRCFYEAINKADAEAHRAVVRAVMTGNNDDKKWYLSHRYAEWGNKITVSGDPERPINVNVINYKLVPDEDLDRLVDLMERLEAAGAIGTGEPDAVDAEYKDVED